MVKFLLGVAWSVFSVVFDACAIWLVWGWHGVPLGLPALSFVRAAGVSVLVHVLVGRTSRDDAVAVYATMKAHDLRRKLRLNPTATQEMQDEANALVEARDKVETDVLWVRRGLWLWMMTMAVVVAKIAAMLAR